MLIIVSCCEIHKGPKVILFTCQLIGRYRNIIYQWLHYYVLSFRELHTSHGLDMAKWAYYVS